MPHQQEYPNVLNEHFVRLNSNGVMENGNDSLSESDTNKLNQNHSKTNKIDEIPLESIIRFTTNRPKFH